MSVAINKLYKYNNKVDKKQIQYGTIKIKIL